MSGLKHMVITGYTDKEFQDAFEGEPYHVMINPESIKWERAVEYNQQQPPGTSAGSPEYKYTPSEKLSFEIVIDCTGVVDKKRTTMKTEIDALEKIVYTYVSDIHQPNYVTIQWGSYLFKGVLSSMDTSYTYFKPNGDPLRAKMSLSFAQYVAPTEVEKKDKPNSPDLSHLVVVKEGDSLPQLCNKIWKDPTYYTQVAAYNGLNKFRHLKGGEGLIFPPIIPTA